VSAEALKRNIRGAVALALVDSDSFDAHAFLQRCGFNPDEVATYSIERVDVSDDEGVDGHLLFVTVERVDGVAEWRILGNVDAPPGSAFRETLARAGLLGKVTCGPLGALKDAMGRLERAGFQQKLVAQRGRPVQRRPRRKQARAGRRARRRKPRARRGDSEPDPALALSPGPSRRPSTSEGGVGTMTIPHHRSVADAAPQRPDCSLLRSAREAL
jgi:hypothetical protein